MNFSSGTKLEINTDSGKTGICLAVCRAVILMAGLAGISAVSRAGDMPTGLADPTRPSYVAVSSGAKAAQRSGPVLQSTFVSASQRRAVISGRSYTVGDKLGDAMITDIQPYEVVLKRAGSESHLRLLPRLVKEASIVKVPANSQEGKNGK
jgi:hypothetical protein